MYDEDSVRLRLLRTVASSYVPSLPPIPESDDNHLLSHKSVLIDGKSMIFLTPKSVVDPGNRFLRFAQMKTNRGRKRSSDRTPKLSKFAAFERLRHRAHSSSCANLGVKSLYYVHQTKESSVTRRKSVKMLRSMMYAVNLARKDDKDLYVDAYKKEGLFANTR